MTSLFDVDDLKRIGDWVWQGYSLDESSRDGWSRRTSAAMDIALQVQKSRSFPWQDSSNVTFPLVTIGALQFHSRAYPAIVKGPDIVRYRTLGNDPGGQEYARAQRVGAHMSWQLLEEDNAWEEQLDRLLINIPIVGCAFKKSYYDARKGHNVSELVLARDLVLDYFAKSVEECQRKTQIIGGVYRNDLAMKMLAGEFRDCSEDPWFKAAPVPFTSQQTADSDARRGQSAPPASFTEAGAFTLLEQHCWMDLDGDGIEEPYIVTIEHSTRNVLRIVARWSRPEDVLKLANGRILGFVAEEYFTKFGFIPAADGGIYDIGFGVLLGPINESVNTLINQMVDAGTLSNTAGGFIGRGAKLKGGQYTFRPFQWTNVDAPGDDLRKNIVPLPVNPPSDVLFKLLALLIDYANRIPGTTDTMVGENPGQNTPASTTQTMVEQGQKIFASIFKRQWRSLKDEFKKLYKLNGVFLPVEPRNFGGAGLQISKADYLFDPTKIVPAADPEVASEALTMQRIMAIKQDSMVTPGYNRVEVTKMWLRALRAENLDVIFPGPDKVEPLPNPKIQVEQMKLQDKAEQRKAEQVQFLLQLQADMRLNEGKVFELQAKAMKEIAEAQGVEKGHLIAAFEAQLGAIKAHQDALAAQVELKLKEMELEQKPPPSDEGGAA